MEIRKEKVEKVKSISYLEETDVFVAFDGKIFRCKDKCLAYESRKEFEKEFDKIKMVKTLPLIPNSETSIGFTSWYKLESLKDLELLKEYITERDAFKEDNFRIYRSLDIAMDYKEVIENEIKGERGFSLVTIGVTHVDTLNYGSDYSEIDGQYDIIPFSSLNDSINDILEIVLEEYDNYYKY